MPAYDYKCINCGQIEEHIHAMSENPEIVCPSCQSSMEKQISASFGGFIFRGGTPASHYKEKRLRMKKREEIGAKQQLKWGGTGPRIKPNIAGVETESWSDAQKMAKEAKLNHESFTPWVEKEKKEKKTLIL